ncbi:hypothetical protein [Pectobacterium carotovorum]|uniref:hypothetical protein n=1 Tax=Pectobacterium carotovorum TaxID=554 RepID=UPI001E641BC8|nr:hypothetical protein [Pectobacterium carotovorum]UFT92859.1 hypothetical protein LQF52_13370 [Pectobacterium carotovorum]
MSEIEEIKSELAKIRSELDSHKALFLTILRELPPQKTSELVLKFGGSFSDLGLVETDPEKKSPITVTQVLFSIDKRK